MHEIIVPGSLGDRDGNAWCNGKMVPWRDIHLHAMGHVVHYASGVFEGIRVYNGRAFQVTEHMARFQQGARALLMRLPFSRRVLEKAAQDIVDEHKIETGYVRPIAWRGAGPVNFDPTPNPANVAIFAWPFHTFLPEGTKLILSEWTRPGPETGPWRIKASGNYLSATLQNHRAKRLGFGDALFLDWQGHIADVTGANIFLVINGVLHTPKPDGFFSGITRKNVMNLAKAEGIRTVVRKIPPNDLRKAQEVFLTGSAAGIVSVGKVDLLDGMPFDYEPQGPTTRQLQALYGGLTKG